MQGKKEAKTTEADGPFGKSAQRRRFKAEKKIHYHREERLPAFKVF